MTVNKWSQTASSNATADGTINWAEGQAPSSVNDSARAMMAAVAKYRDDNAGSLTTAGTSTAYTLTSNQSFASLSAMSGHTVTFKAHTTSGASPTLNVDSLGAKALKSVSGTTLPTGYLVSGGVYSATYDNSAAEWVIHGVPGAIGSLASLSVSGTSTLGGALTVSSGGAAITGNSAITGTLSTSSALTVSAGGANITGDSALTGTLTASAGLTASGAVTGATAAGAMVATQAEMETATATNKLVTPGRAQYHPGMAKAWVKFAGASGTINASHNITSVVRNSAGNYTVTIDTDFSGAEYVVTAMAHTGTNNAIRIGAAPAAGSFQLQVTNLSGVAFDPDAVMVVSFGDQ